MLACEQPYDATAGAPAPIAGGGETLACTLRPVFGRALRMRVHAFIVVPI